MKALGTLLIIAGMLIFTISVVPWMTARQSAEALTATDKQRVERVTAVSTVQYSPPPSASSVQPTKKWSEGEKAAVLIIPKMNRKFPVYYGTNEKVLKKGVGMYSDKRYTSLPGEGRHVVLSGHRDTVFDGLDTVKRGDILAVEMGGVLYSYQVQKHWITHKEDRTVIVPKDEEVLTLTTCYPFDYLGDAPDRYIVQAKRIINE